MTLLSGDGQFEDVVGNHLDGSPSFRLPSGDGQEGGDFSLNFTVDVGLSPFPLPLEAIVPLGSLVHDSVVDGQIGLPGDFDSFTIDLDAGQSMTVLIDDPSSTLRAQLEILDPGLVARVRN